MSVVIKKLKRDEAASLAKAFASAQKEDFSYYPAHASKIFNKIWDEKYFRGNKKVFVVAKDAEVVVGFLVGRHQWLDNGLGTIEWFWVEKKYRGQGIAKKMMAKAETLFSKSGHHKIILEADNPKSWDVYRKLGFQEEGFFKNHGWHHDEYRYGKVLK